MNIIITDMANITPFVLPVTPSNLKMSNSGDNKEEETLNGKISVAKSAKLRIVEWESIFPVNKNYSFIRTGSLPNGWSYVTFIESMRVIQLPIRVIVTTKNNMPVMNMLATIDSFDYSVDNSGDIKYSINLKEYPELIYQFAIRDWNGIKNGWKYVQETIKNKEVVEKLKKAGLWLVNREYK